MNTQPISAIELLELIEANNQNELESISNKLVKGVTTYLEMMHNAPQDEAENAAQEAFATTFEKIKKGELAEVENLPGYLMNFAKLYYFQEYKQKKKADISFDEELYEPPFENQMENLIENLDSPKRKKTLMHCIDQLSEEQRKFVFRLLRYIEESDTNVAKRLHLKYRIYRVRKFRLIHILHECVQKYLPSQI